MCFNKSNFQLCKAKLYAAASTLCNLVIRLSDTSLPARASLLRNERTSCRNKTIVPRRNHSQYWLQSITVVMFKKQLWRRYLRKQDRENVISRIPLRKKTRKKIWKSLWWRESHKLTQIFKWSLLSSLHQTRKGMYKALSREKHQDEGKIKKGEKQRKWRTGRLERLQGTRSNSHLNPQITSKLTKESGALRAS